MMDNDKNLFVLSDLIVDYHIDESLFEDGIQTKQGTPSVSGTGFNAAYSFYKHGLKPTLLGYVGNDVNGKLIKDKVIGLGISSKIKTHYTKKTTVFHMIISKLCSHTIRLSVDNKNNSNDLTRSEIIQLLVESNVKKGDYIFITSHFFYRISIENCKKIIDTILEFKLLIILDLVPHIVYEKISYKEFMHVFSNGIHILISEIKTLSELFKVPCDLNKPTDEDLNKILVGSKSTALVVSYGKENYTSHKSIMNIKNNVETLSYIEETGFTKLSPTMRLGFGDNLVSKFMIKLIKGRYDAK
jgi:sugar/nucleoside kinase (ribokinase family)